MKSPGVYNIFVVIFLTGGFISSWLRISNERPQDALDIMKTFAWRPVPTGKFIKRECINTSENEIGSKTGRLLSTYGGSLEAFSHSKIS